MRPAGVGLGRIAGLLSAARGWVAASLKEDHVTDLKAELHRELRAGRAGLLSKLDGLTAYDMRRPMTPTATNLLGLVKHLAGLEYGYLGASFDRPAPEPLAWVEDGSIWDGADMWARPDESGKYIVELYRRACAHADRTITDLALDTPGQVPHWPEDRRATTLGVLLVRMVSETARHAGHADVLRELVDGEAGPDHDGFGDEAEWRRYHARVQAAADTHRASGGPRCVSRSRRPL
ncbi:DinB superfamily protein [Streptomyces rubrolavendulae]|uniref:DinB superfamily protein n=1 Tax=Streptomyces rubrolavendulae TaxID=285473 RepID=A0A1D8GAJ4_9ACTN|nr:DinB superfamily protein [Streptomyces rubrolavendulae]